MDSGGWSLTESDPGIFTGLLNELGVQGLEVEELYGLDQELLEELEPVHALIFLFKWQSGLSDVSSSGTPAQLPESGYFAQQVITNACGTIAVLNSVMNVPGVKLGEELETLQAFSLGLDSEMTGATLSNSEKIRTVHNSFARGDPYHLEEARDSKETEDAYHFIAYLPIGDTLYELDGLKPYPISHGTFTTSQKWTQLAKTVIEQRIATYPAGEVHFNLMAISGRAAALTTRLEEIEKELENATDKAALQNEKATVGSRLLDVQERLKHYEEENTLRRHNYIGLIHGLLGELEKSGELEGRIELAKKKMEERVAKMKEAQKAGGADADAFMEED